MSARIEGWVRNERRVVQALAWTDLNKIWRPQGESNPCCRRERAMS